LAFSSGIGHHRTPPALQARHCDDQPQLVGPAATHPRQALQVGQRPSPHCEELSGLQSRVKWTALLLALVVTLAGCNGEEPPAAGAMEPAASRDGGAQATEINQAFRRFLADNYAVDMARAPYTASYRGIKTWQDRWNPVTEVHLQESRELNEARLRTLRDFDPARLGESERLSWLIYKATLERALASDRFRHHKFVIHQYRGPHTQFANNLINIHTVSDVADAEAYIGRLNNIGEWFDGVVEQLRIRERKGFFLADWQYPKMIEAARNVISGRPYDDGEDSSVWADFRAKVAALDISQPQRADLLSRAETALLDAVRPAYLMLIAELEHQATLASGEDGVWKFEDGDAFYAERLNWYTTTDLDAGQIHRIGLREVARIHDEMRAIMAQVGFRGTLAEFFVFMREDPQFYYPDTDAGRAAYLTEARRVIGEMRAYLPALFGVLPKAGIKVKRVEAFRERSAGKAFYQKPLPDGSRPGIYYANLLRMADLPRYQLEALAFHEGVPGHHMQQAIVTELEGVPEFQKYSSFTAYTEGWALYAERVAKELGFYADPYADFGRLAMELWRACRLVVDTGIHHRRWSREQAAAYLVENTPNSVDDASESIERYIAMPGQATAYMIGKLKLVELRQRAEQALGDAFDIRQFHDTVLQEGPMPLWLLEQKIDALIAASG
jgi:uncharacterized protein (DUF885 family)